MPTAGTPFRTVSVAPRCLSKSKRLPPVRTTGNEFGALASAMPKQPLEAETAKLKKGGQENSRTGMETKTQDTTPQKSERELQLHNQLSASRNQWSKRLSEINKYIFFLERKQEDTTTTVRDTYECLQKVSRALVSLSRLAESAAAAVKFGAGKEDAVDKLLKLEHQLQLAGKALRHECEDLSDHIPRRVPVSWYGPACEVRLMGDFDGWTRGQELSAEVIDDSVLTEYVAELELLPVGQLKDKPLVQ